MDDSKFLITGANGQLGRALQAKYPNAKATTVNDFDITDHNSVSKYDWSGITTILNAAAYTDVDGAETQQGRMDAWKVNALGVANLARLARERDLLLVHLSTDYVFDGTQTTHLESEAISPLSVYGASKAAGDVVAASLPKYCLIRSAWVIGEGKNFVRTMLDLGRRGISPTVVADQIGRPTFTTVLTDAIDHLLKAQAAYGTYNVTNDGDSVSWAELTREIFKKASFNLEVIDTTTEKYFSSKPNVAKRPLNSTLDLIKIKSTGFKPDDWRDNLSDYIKKELGK
jgi:dTDP-4-dehydrorhamnose 3,5-epimerase/reductase